MTLGLRGQPTLVSARPQAEVGFPCDQNTTSNTVSFSHKSAQQRILLRVPGAVGAKVCCWTQCIILQGAHFCCLQICRVEAVPSISTQLTPPPSDTCLPKITELSVLALRWRSPIAGCPAPFVEFQKYYYTSLYLLSAHFKRGEKEA